MPSRESLALTVLPQAVSAAECTQVQNACTVYPDCHFIICQPDISENQKPDISEDPGSENGSYYDRQVAALVNQERSAYGLPKLSFDSELAELAQLKAEDMAENNYFSHQSPSYGSAFDMMRAAGISYRSAGENIARGQNTPEEVMNSWMNSSGHRANILSSSYTSLGVGCAADKDGRIYWVQIFRG